MTDNKNYRIKRKIWDGIKSFAVITALFGLVSHYTGKHYGNTNESPLRPKMDIDSNYQATLVKIPLKYGIIISKKNEKGNYLYGNDFDRDTIIDEIGFGTKSFNLKNSPDSTLINLASVKELSKIEKELLEE